MKIHLPLRSKLSFPLLLLVAVGGTGGAIPSAQAKDGKVDFHVEEPGPLQPRTRRVHDGFYLRAATGPGYSWERAVAGGRSYQLDGVSGGVSLAVGGTVAPGFVAGLFALGSLTFNPRVEGVGGDFGGSGTMLLGPFLDLYPNDRGPWHFGMGVGYLETRWPEGILDQPRGDGAGGYVDLGLDFFTDDEVSLGPLLTAYYGATTSSGSQGEATSTTVAGVNLWLTLLYQ